jgi:quinoprotein glucose dehydrogenase
MRCLALICVPGLLLAADGDWPNYGRDAGGTRFSPLKQIDKTNVDKLQVAWEFHTGEPKSRNSAFEATPIFVDGTLYLSTPFNQVIALDPATGQEKWRYNPEVDRTKGYSENTSRGVGYWKNPQGGGRIFFGTLDARLIAVDAATGKPCADFGKGGQVDLTQDIELRDRGDYQVTSPPAIVGDHVIVGSSIGDNRAVNVERGTIRAFDVHTGTLVWKWEPIPWADKSKPRTGAANAWSVIAADPKRDMVFIPTGSAAPDFYGGLRPGDDRNANSVVALKASTGKELWAFQVVHHDLWDYDVAAQPSLFIWKGKPAVAVSTKMGFVFVLDRLTGKPLIPVEERRVPASDIEGETASLSQPFPATDPLVPTAFKPEDAWGVTPEDQKWCQDQVAKLRNEGIYTPPSLGGSLFFPGNIGGINWGAAAVDDSASILVANTNRLATMVKLIPRKDVDAARKTTGESRIGGEFGRQEGAPYAMYRETFLGPHRLPCNAPPWGTVSAMDLKTGKKKWEVPLGELLPGRETGTPNLGGPIITAGGLVFDAATMDTTLRAFELETGKVLWKAQLPASAQATPMTFEWQGRQYLVICAGGHGKLGTKQGDSVVAFALPKQ